MEFTNPVGLVCILVFFGPLPKLFRIHHNELGHRLQDAYLGKDVKVGEPQGGLLGRTEGILAGRLGQELPSGVFVEQLEPILCEPEVPARFLSYPTYVRPRCDERNFSMERPISCNFVENGFRHSASRSW